MKSLAELKAIRDRMQGEVNMREDDIIHHHENSNDKINAGIRVREKHSQYCFACIRNSISSQTSRYLYRVKKNQPNIK